MGDETKDIDLGTLDVPRADQVQPRVESVQMPLGVSVRGYDLGDLGVDLDPGVIRRHVRMQRAKVEAEEAKVAGWLARILVGLLSVGTLLYLVLAFLVSAETALEAGSRVLSFLTPLVGVVVGYYFSGKRQRS